MIHRSFYPLMALAIISACSTFPMTQKSTKTPQVQSQSVRRIAKPPMIDMPSPNFNERPEGTKISAIVLHHTAMASDAKRVGKFFARPNAGVSSHYIVDRTGYIVQPVADKHRAWHAGRSTFQGKGNVNNYSIGIEICNLGDSKEPYPEAQYDAIIKLVAHLSHTYQIPLSRITRHRDISIPPGRKIDTSNNFSVPKVLEGVQALFDGKTLPAPPPAQAAPQVGETLTVTLKRNHPDLKDVADILLDNENRWKEIQYLNPRLKATTLRVGMQIKLPTDVRFADIAEREISD